jgi:hypothetical protein
MVLSTGGREGFAMWMALSAARRLLKLEKVILNIKTQEETVLGLVSVNLEGGFVYQKLSN